MANIVLVPGAFHGAWYFDGIIPRLREAGHNVLALTLTGMSSEQTAGSVNLDTHVHDVVRAIERADLDKVVLVGHSYAGLVITGVADRLASRVDSLVYLDALVPQDGQRGWDLLNDFFKAAFLAGVAQDGLTIAPPPDVGARAARQPLACFLQNLKFGGQPFSVRSKSYVYCSSWAESPFAPIYDRLTAMDDWTTFIADTGHDVVAEAADLVVDVIQKSAQGSLI